MSTAVRWDKFPARRQEIETEDFRSASTERPRTTNEGRANNSTATEYTLSIEDEGRLVAAFEEKPVTALRQLVYGMLREGRDDTGNILSLNRFKAIRFIFDRMIDGTPFMRRLGSNAILSFADPGEILAVALNEYRLYGYDVRLTTAASLLSRFGASAWTVLRLFAKSGLPECESFVTVIANLDGVPEQARLQALVDLASIPDPSTRIRVYEAVERFDSLEKNRVLDVLATTGGDDDYARQCALSSLNIDM